MQKLPFPLQIAYVHYRYSNIDELTKTTKNIDNSSENKGEKKYRLG